MASAEDITALRTLLGEDIPVDGSEADTLFTDTQLYQMLSDANGSRERAAYEGWRAKAAQYASLVTVSEGAATRELSNLQKQALAMVTLYAKATTGPTEGRARVGRIVRR